MPANPIVEILPLIVRLFPELVDVPILGKVIPLFNVDPESETDMVKKLARKLELKPKRGFNDAVHVVKVSDVKACLESKLGDGTIGLAILKGLLNALRGDTTVSSNIIGDKIMDCVRSKTLRQTTPRTKNRKTTIGRPAKGHGRGRRFS